MRTLWFFQRSGFIDSFFSTLNAGERRHRKVCTEENIETVQLRHLIETEYVY
jgi:hypothetical protein